MRLKNQCLNNKWIEIKNIDSGEVKISTDDNEWIEVLSVKVNKDKTGEIRGVQNKSLFGLFDIKIRVEVKVDIQGIISEIKTPWYSYLLW